jgi:hypothetical protein
MLSESRSGGRTRFDIPGVLLVTGGLVALVYGPSQAESDGWGSAKVIGLLAGGAVLLAAFGLVEIRVSQPMPPPRLIASRTRGGAYLSVGPAMAGMFGAFLFMTYYLQVVKGYSPIRTGVAFLPMTVAVLLPAGGLATRLLPKVPPRMLLVPGMLLIASGMLWLRTMETGTGYVEGLLVSGLLLGFGAGMVMPVAFNYATHGVEQRDAGIARHDGPPASRAPEQALTSVSNSRGWSVEPAASQTAAERPGVGEGRTGLGVELPQGRELCLRGPHGGGQRLVFRVADGRGLGEPDNQAEPIGGDLAVVALVEVAVLVKTGQYGAGVTGVGLRSRAACGAAVGAAERPGDADTGGAEGQAGHGGGDQRTGTAPGRRRLGGGGGHLRRLRRSRRIQGHDISP